MGERRGRVRLAVFVVSVLVAAGCGARFEDTAATRDDGLSVGSGGGEATQTTLESTGDTLPGDETSPTTAIGGTGGTGGTTTTSAGGGRAIAAGSTTGITADTIKVGVLVPISGAAPVPAQFDKGVRSYYEEVNAKGGIGGRKIQVVIEDTQSSASVGKTRAQKLIEQDKVFTIVVLDRLENQKAIGEYIDSRQVPNIQVQTPANLSKSMTWTFGVTIDHAVQGRLIAEYFVKSLKATKVAVVQENTPILNAGRQAFEDQIAKLGADVVYKASIDGQGNDYSSEALGLSRSGARATWLYMAPTPAAKLVNQADALGYHPVWFANSISWGFDLIFTVAPKALAGARAFSPWLPMTDPRTQEYQRAYRAHNDNETPDDIGVIGWGIGQIVVEGIRRAGPQLGQNSFREALQQLQFRPDVWAPLSFGAGVRQGANVVAVLKEAGGRWTLERDFTDSF